MGDYRILSSDDHIFEPPDMWTSRVATKYKDRAPRVIRLDNGEDWWFTDGNKGQSIASGAQTGFRYEGVEKLSFGDQFENVRPGGYNPDERIKDMDIDGVEISVIYPNQGNLLYSLPDTELVNVLMETYNDYIAEHCNAHPERLKGLALINLDDIQWGIKELERCQKLGLVGALIPVYPMPDRGYHLPEYEPFWAAAEDLGMPLSLHLSTNRIGSVEQLVDIETLTPEYFCNSDYWPRMSIAAMIFAGVFERHSQLSVGSIEHELAWVPHFLSNLDYQYTQRAQLKHWLRYKEDMLPSEYFRSNIFLGFQEDGIGIKYRHDIGVDLIQWGSDYPHLESTWPRSRQLLNELLGDCTEEEKAQIAGLNAARVYHLS